MTYIKNSDQLLSHGNIPARRMALEIIEHALAAADPYRATRRLVGLKGDVLTVGTLRFDLKQHRRIFLLGAGKATFPIAKAMEELLGSRITEGVVICKYGQQGKLNRARLILAGHPIPDEQGLTAARQAMALARQTRPADIVFGCNTGGSSALMVLPVEGIDLDEKKTVNQLLLTCGANIIEINSVRKHLSKIKGGRLSRAIHDRALLINLTVSDVIGDPLDYITGPTVPDTSTLEDARAVLSKYELWSRVPASVADFLRNAGQDQETPKPIDMAKRKQHDFIILPAHTICEAALQKAADLGMETMILSTMLEGESRELGRTFVSIAGEIARNGRPLKPPCAVIGGGETTVKIDGRAGLGGPNQEFVLGAALEIGGISNVLVAAIDSDGTDGPTQSAGGIADQKTTERARVEGVDLFALLGHHDAGTALDKLGDSIVTGATGTNVNDLKLMLVFPEDEKGQSLKKS
jgi:glycerate-2-kinase